ncbi:hypothetical protein J6590_012127 [Homalodisca vitripennis]|nr:hypothetical protein J6590_012127 [Homalodisca vitripennis]
MGRELSYRKPLPILRQRSKSSDLVDNVTAESRRRPFSWCAALLYFRAAVSASTSLYCTSVFYCVCNRLVMGDTLRIWDLPRSEEGAISFLQDHDLLPESKMCGGRQLRLEAEIHDTHSSLILLHSGRHRKPINN